MLQKTFTLALFFTLSIFGLQAQNTIFTIKDTAIAARLLKESIGFNSTGKYELAIAKADSALLIFENVLGKESEFAANALVEKGTALRRLGKFDDAMKYQEKALAIRLKLFPKNDPSVAYSYSIIGGLHKFKGNSQKFLEYTSIATGIREKILKKNDPLLVSAYNALGNAYTDNTDFPKAVDNFTNALNLLLKYHPENVEFISNIYGNIAVVYNTTGQFNKAKEIFEKVLAVQTKALASDNLSIALTYNNMGTLKNKTGDYNKAIEYLTKSLNIFVKKPLDLNNNSNIEFCLRNLGVSYQNVGEYDKSIDYSKQGLAVLIQKKGAKHAMIGDFYTNMGLCFLSNNKTDSAIFYIQKALDFQLKLDPDEDLEIARYYSHLGMAYNQKQDFDQALTYFQKALNIKAKSVGSEHPYVTATLEAIGETYFYKKDYKKALEYLDKTLLSEHYTVKKDFSLINNKEEITNALKTYSLIYGKMYEDTRDIKHLELASFYAQQAVESLNFYEESLNTEGSKSLLKNKTYNIYETAIQANYRLAKQGNKDSLTSAIFQNIEKSKAKSLQTQLKSAQALNFSGIPDSILQQELTLQESINFSEKKRKEKLEEGKSETDSIILALSSKLFDLKQQSEDLKKDFGRDYPDYYRLKYAPSNISVKDIQQKMLTADKTLVEYFVGDSSIFIFTINQKDFEVVEIKNDFDVNGLVKLMRKGIRSDHGAANDLLRNASFANFTEGASKLYEKLIAPVKSRLKKHVIIIPDGVLGYLPFEALLIKQDTKPNRFHAHTYLLNDHDISYGYSAAMLNEMIKKEHRQKPTGFLLGMAPFYSGDTTVSADILAFTETNRDTLKTLPASGQEVANIVKLTKGQAYYGKDATVKNFLKLAPQYRILHLATHGKANDKLGDYSYLAFFNPKDSLDDGRLYVRDLYNLNLNADLVVLSACETGIGELQRGEGIISLARAFTYAGAKSIVTTLWQIGDEKSKILMTDFYKYLRKGQSKEAALSNAKRDFIKKTNSDPFYWAGFIGLGDWNVLK